MDKKAFFIEHKWGILICLTLIVIGVVLVAWFFIGKSFRNPEEMNDGQPPYHIERNGKVYFYRGNLLYELPEGYERTGKDYDDNGIRGDVYENPKYPEGIYFLMEGWDSNTSGEQPYLLFEIIEE